MALDKADDNVERSDEWLVGKLNLMSTDAVTQNSEFNTRNTDLFDRYTGELYGDETEDRSSVLANDVEDTIDSYMVSAARVFLGSSPIVEFLPVDPEDEEDVAEADQKTAYANWLIRGQEDSYQTLYSVLLEILLLKFGAVKYYALERRETTEQSYSAISEEELADFMESLEDENVESVEITEKSGDFNGEDKIDFKFKIKNRLVKEIKIVPVPGECLIISKNAKTKSDAPIVGDDTPITRGELVEMGYTKEKVADAPTYSGDKNQNTRLDEQRDKQQGSDTTPWKSPSWASEQVLLRTRYALIDYNADGIAERRYCLYAGDVVFENEMFDHEPYAIGSSYIMPSRVIGRSVGEKAEPFAEQNTAIMRGMFDNIYSVSAPRIAHNENVNQDDLYDQEHGAAIRVQGKENPGNSMFPIEMPYIGDKTLQVLQFQSQRRAEAVGTQLSSQGLDADDFAEESVARFNGVQDTNKGKVELVIRNIAETFFKDLFVGVIWTAIHFQDTEQEILVTGKPLKFTPSAWKYDHQPDVKVGLGAGDEDKIVETMQGILGLQGQLKAQGSTMVDDNKTYNAITRLVKGLGLSDVNSFFNDPSVDLNQDQLTQISRDLQAENEQLKAMVQELQVNPLKEAELVKQEGTLIKNQQDNQVKLMQLAQKDNEHTDEMFNKAADREFDYTELEVKESVDIPTKGVNG